MKKELTQNRLTELDIAEKLALEDNNLDNWPENYNMLIRIVSEKIDIVKEHLKYLKNAN